MELQPKYLEDILPKKIIELISKLYLQGEI